MEIDDKILSFNPDESRTDKETNELIRKLLNLLEHALKEIAELREENQKLKDENRRMKGGSPRPRILPNTKADSTIKRDEKWVETEKKEWAKE